MASKWNEPPRDALDTLVHGAADLDSLKDVKQVRFLPFVFLVRAFVRLSCTPVYVCVRVSHHRPIEEKHAARDGD